MTGADPTEDRRTILFLDHTATLGGGELALLQLVSGLDRQRYEPVVVLSSEGPLCERLAQAGIETHVIPMAAQVVYTRKDNLRGVGLLRVGNMARSLLYVVRLARFIRQRRARLVHANSLKADVVGGLAARLAGVPVLWHVRDRIEEDYLPAPAVRLFRRLCRLLPTAVIANSRSTLETLRLPGRLRAEVIYSGVPESLLDTSDAPSAPDQDSPEPRAPVIGLVGRISPWKGQHVFVEAAGKVHRCYPRARFRIIGAALFGEDAYEAEVRAMTRRLGLEECLEFTGFQPDPALFLSGLDILVHASTTGEPFGKVVAEGMAAGKPVVATRGGGVPEIVEDGVTGLLVPMEDMQALAGAVMYLLAHPEQARAMGHAGRERIRARFTLSHTIRQVCGLYEELLRGRA